MSESRPAPKARRLLLLLSMIATVVVYLAPAAQALPTVITVTKTASPAEGGSVIPGATITYTVTIQNGAGDIATGVSLTDGTPANTTYVAGSASINGGPSIPGATNPFADGEPIPDIPVSGSATATFQVTVSSPLANGTTISNVASASATNDAASPKTDGATHTVASSPNLSVTKTSSPAEGGTVNPGDTITYTVVVANQASGSDTATGVSLTDATPANTTYVAGSATVDTVPVAGATNPFQTGYALSNLAPGASHTITFQALVDRPLPNNTPISNTATASAANNPNVSDGASHTVTSMPGLTVEKTASPAAGGPITPGDTTTYTIVVSNDPQATETATGVSLTDATPADTTYVAGSATVDTVQVTGATNPFEAGYALPDMAPGDSHTLRFQALVDIPLDNGTSITNTVTVSSTQGPDATDETIHTVDSAPTLTFAKTSAPAEAGKVTPGTTITYTLTVSNDTAATETAHNLTLLDPAPANTTYVEGSAKLNGTAITGTGNPFATAFALPDLLPGELHTVTFDVQVASPLANGTVISNLAELTGDNHPDLEDGATHTVDSSAVLKALASSSPQPGSKLKAGDTIAYSTYVENDPRATASAPDVKISMPTPDGTTFVNGSAKLDGAAISSPSSGASGLAAPGSNPLANGYSLGTMAPGDSHTVSYKVTVKGSAGAITNTITISVGGQQIATGSITHRGPNTGSGNDDSDGSDGGTKSSSETISTSSESGLAFTGLDLARLLLLALTLLLVGWTLLARGRSLQRRTARAGEDHRTTGFPAWDRWAGAWFYPQR